MRLHGLHGDRGIVVKLSILKSLNMKTFDDYFEWLMKWEGEVFENDPADPGGATKFGIDQRSHPLVNIRTLTRDQAKEIYRAEYWLAVKADKLPWPINWIVADIGVNNGKGRAIKWLQEPLGVLVDGKIGTVTVGAACAADIPKLRQTLLNRREAFYRSIAKGAQAKFLKGWLNRNDSLREVTV